MAKKRKEKKQKLDEDFLTSHARNVFDASSNFRGEEIEQRWVDSNELYDSQFKTSKDKKKSDVLLGQGRLFIPKTYTSTQRMLVDILDAFFFDPEEIVSVSSWKTIPSSHREITKALLNYRLNSHPINFYQEAYEASLDALRNKVGIFKVFPKLKNKGKKTTFTPHINCIPFEDVFFDATSTWKDYHQKPIIHRMLLPLDHLKRQGYKNLDMVDTAGDPSVGDEVKEQRADDQGSPFNPQTKVTEAKLVYVFDIWTHLDIDKTGFLESVNYMMAGGIDGPEVLIRDIKKNDLPYEHEGEDYNRPPFAVGQAFPESHKMYGKDLPEIVEGLQRETNAIRNGRREAAALALRPPLMAARGSGIDLMSLVNRRVGGVVLGNDISPNSIRELPISDVAASSYRDSSITDQDFFEASSIPPNLLGTSTPGEQSATESTQQNANANKKISMVIKSLAQTLYVPAFTMLLRLEQKYETDKFIQEVTGRILGWEFADDGVPSKNVIKGDFDLKVNTGLNKQVQLNKFFLLMDRANQANTATAGLVQAGVVAPENAQFFDTVKLFDKVFPLMGEKDVEEFKVKAQAPPVEAGGQVAGVASQPALPGGAEGSNVINLNPEGV